MDSSSVLITTTVGDMWDLLLTQWYNWDRPAFIQWLIFGGLWLQTPRGHRTFATVPQCKDMMAIWGKKKKELNNNDIILQAVLPWTWHSLSLLHLPTLCPVMPPQRHDTDWPACYWSEKIPFLCKGGSSEADVWQTSGHRFIWHTCQSSEHDPQTYPLLEP